MVEDPFAVYSRTYQSKPDARENHQTGPEVGQHNYCGQENSSHCQTKVTEKFLRNNLERRKVVETKFEWRPSTN